MWLLQRETSLRRGEAGILLLSYLFKKKNIIISGIGSMGCISHCIKDVVLMHFPPLKCYLPSPSGN